MQPVKVIVIGPVGTGKTTISNFLADVTEMSMDYRPTEGVRILEFEISNVNVHNKHSRVDVELWDCSGNQTYEDCWPAIRNDAQGVVFVYNKKSDDQMRQLEKLYDFFVVRAKLEPKNCLIFFFEANETTEAPKKMAKIFAKISQVNCNIEEGGKKLKADFQALLSTIITRIEENMELEETNILKDNVNYLK